MKRILVFGMVFSIASVASAQSRPLFEDDFNSGDFSNNVMLDGTSFRWSPRGVMVSSSASHSGEYSAQFVFGPNAEDDDSFKELGFRFGRPLSEVWVEYWILYPKSYYHRSQSGASNNKFFQLNYNGSPKQMLTIESDVQNGGNSFMRRFLSTTQNPGGSRNWPLKDNNTTDFIGSSENFLIQAGKWTKVLVHYKVGSDGIKSNGEAEVWINDNLIHGLDWPFWEPDHQGAINGGYILGWSNSGFSQPTHIYIDDFKIYDSAPDSRRSTAPMPPGDFRIGNQK